MKQKDLRVIRTKKNIHAAFLRLLEQKSYNDISVQNIADEAMINRNTFYLHYESKVDLLESLLDSILKELDAKIPICVINTNQEANKALANIVNVLQKDHELFTRLLQIDDISKFSIRIKNLMRDRFNTGVAEERHRHTMDRKAYDLMIEYKISGLIAAFEHWFNHYDEYDPDNVLRIFAVLNEKAWVEEEDLKLLEL